MSSQRVAAPTPQSASQKPSKPEDNVVIIPVDGSRQADMAFACKFVQCELPVACATSIQSVRGLTYI